MLPILPRQMLWTELKTMDEFFRLDPVNEDFFEVFSKLREEPFGVQLDAVKVFNEVYYQATRMMFEKPLPDDMPKYISDIKANMGWNYSAELVMTMVFFMGLSLDRRVNQINRYSKGTIEEKFAGCPYWEPFKKLSEHLHKEKRYIDYSFPPCPNEIKDLQKNHIRWSVITQKYDLSCIEHVINLWSDINDQKEIALMIKGSMSMILGINHQKTDLKQISRFIDKYLHDETKYEDSIENKLRIRLQTIINEDMRRRIAELETENTHLKTLLEKKKINGSARKFTLVEIVNYCKGCVVWDDAKSIVAMLNKLLRRIGTDEDSDLVDSIEAEFINRRHGNTFNNANVTMQNPQIQDVYRITGNDTVNLGESQDGEEE